MSEHFNLLQYFPGVANFVFDGVLRPIPQFTRKFEDRVGIFSIVW